MFHRIRTESTVSDRRIQQGMLVKGILLLTSIMLTVFPPYLVAQEFARDVADDVRKDIRSAIDDEAVAAASLKNMRKDAGFWMSINQETTETSDNVLRVDLMVEGIQELHAFQFDFSFDPATLEVTAVEEGNVLATDGAETYWCSTGSKAVDTISAASARIVSDGISESGVLSFCHF